MNRRQFTNRILTGILIRKGKRSLKEMRRDAADAFAANERTLLEILASAKDSEIGKKYGFSEIHSVEEYQKRVPVSTYADFDSYVERTYFDNEQNLLTGDAVIGFSTTSGSAGKSKLIPVTAGMSRYYTDYTLVRMMALADEYWKKETGSGIRGGFVLPVFEVFHEESPHGLPSTNIVDITARKYGKLFPYFLNIPLKCFFTPAEIDPQYDHARFGLENKDITYLFAIFANLLDGFVVYLKENWQMLVDDIEKGTVSESVYVNPDVRRLLNEKLKPNPERARELRAEFEKGFDNTILSRIWPNLKVIHMIATSPAMEPFARDVLSYADGIPVDYAYYGASEGLFAVATELNNPGQLLLTGSCFYEFIEEPEEGDIPCTPCEAKENGDIPCKPGEAKENGDIPCKPGEAKENGDTAEKEILTIDRLEPGKKYELIITTRAGFYRYRLNDIIVVTGRIGSCPVVNFLYRKNQLINLITEKTNLDQMNMALEKFMEKTGLPITGWTVSSSGSGVGNHYILYLEGTGKEDYSAHEKEMDECLCLANPKYAEFRRSGIVRCPRLYNQTPGTHRLWRDKKVSEGASPDQVKPVTVLDTEEKKQFFSGRTFVIPSEKNESM